MKCPKCNNEMVKNGSNTNTKGERIQKYLCRACEPLKKPNNEGRKIKAQDETVLVIGDTHIPFEHPQYLGFCKRIYDKYKCTKVYHVGDLVDNHAICYHEHNPNGRSPLDEYHMTLGRLTQWYNAFPEVYVCKGNHDELPSRKAITNGIPDVMIKTFREIWCLPDTWNYEEYFTWQDVMFFHGTGFSGKYPMSTARDAKRYNVVIGHLHGALGVHYTASELDCIFGMSVGCGIDTKAYTFDYGKNSRCKPILSCGVITHTENGDLLPICIPMQL